MDDAERERMIEELDTRLGIELQAKGQVTERDPERDHALAHAVADCALQVALVLAEATAENCECPPGRCPTENMLRLVLTGIVLPGVAVANAHNAADLSVGEVIDLSKRAAEKLHIHARASIGRPL